MRCTVGIALHGDRRYADHWRLGKPSFEFLVFRLAGGEAEPPAIVMDHDGDVVRVVECGGAAIERGIIELPLR